MNSATIYDTIRRVVESCLPGSRIVLFGSRARGDHDRFSDYDLLIVTPSTFTASDKIQWSTRLNKAIVEAIKAPVDILLHSEEEVKQKQVLPGNIIRSALKEGIAL
jgi:predicted nucleotidyltransferase